ncbi:arginyltransferase [Spiribacter roseus]|uniref:Aspartate/glutamate leucyltransferase n=1 Tax=Spiribacter roseus TaxID=1855875 RepID=A0ABV3RWM7_9GAMM
MTGSDAPTQSIRLFGTGYRPCPYLHDRPSQFDFVDPRLTPTAELYDALLAQGFRRGGEHLYRNACPGCQLCQSTRIPVARFQPRRRHRRCRRDNADVYLRDVGFRYSAEHFALYSRYVSARHPGGGMDDADADLYWQYLTSEWCPTAFLELRQTGSDQLLAVAVTDDTGAAFSAVYTFYEPELTHRGLGTLAILMQIEEARRRQRDWLYLGYWIAGCPGMDYKTGFHPHERLSPRGWIAEG